MLKVLDTLNATRSGAEDILKMVKEKMSARVSKVTNGFCGSLNPETCFAFKREAFDGWKPMYRALRDVDCPEDVMGSPEIALHLEHMNVSVNCAIEFPNMVKCGADPDSEIRRRIQAVCGGEK